MRKLMWLVLAALPASALTTVDAPANHVVPIGTWSGVTQIQEQINFRTCSGVLLSTGMHVLTAAHCVSQLNSTAPLGPGVVNIGFTLINGGLQYTDAQIFINPGYVPLDQPNPGGDLAIILLNQMVDPNADRYQIYTGSDEVAPGNNPVTLVGFGFQGSGAAGSGGGFSGTKRQGLNDYDAAYSNGNFLLYDFDNGLAANNAIPGSNLGQGVNEVMNAPGDSGGPTFIGNQVAGIHSFVACPATLTIDFDGSCTQAIPGPNSSFGEIGGDARVSLYATWINSVLAGTADTPEPATYGFMAAGLALFGLMRRSKK